MPARNPKFPYYSNLRVPYRFTLSYFAIMFILAYALGIQVASPIDPPTGFAAKNQMAPIPAAPTTTTIYVEPPPTIDSAGRSGTKASGFNVLQPIGTEADIDRGTLEVRFLKVIETEISIEGIEVINNETGRKCARIGYDNGRVISLSASGCDTTKLIGAGVAYDIVTRYAIESENGPDLQVSRGRILATGGG
ncbi:MAG: hypothetical protein V1875_09980 [Candidatus Altiarchaeota archaeon]